MGRCAVQIDKKRGDRKYKQICVKLEKVDTLVCVTAEN